MACAPRWVTAYVDGELEPGSRLVMEQHLASCRACTAQVGDERVLQFRLRALGEPRLPTSLAAFFGPASRRSLAH